MLKLGTLSQRGSFERPIDSQSGAALVEFAIVMVLFLTLLFGIMEAGWAFAQSVEIRSAAREGGRIAVVDYGDAATIAAEVCNRAHISGSGTKVTVVLLPDNDDPTSVQVTVAKTYTSLTNFIPFFNGIELSSDVEMRVERELTQLTAGILEEPCE